MASAPRDGFHFRPTNEEIINLLRLKVKSQQLPPTVVVEKTLYGNNAEPWKVFSDDDNWEIFDGSGKKSTKRIIYVFAKLSKISAKKIARTAGCGRWNGQSKADVLNSQEQVIGSMKMLNYVLNSGSPVKGGWIMHEYSLADTSLHGIGSTDFVICRITRDDEKYTKVKKMVAVAKQKVNQDCSKRGSKNPKVSGKRSNPNSQQENSNPSKILRNTSTNAIDMAIVSSIESPNHLDNYEEHVLREEIGIYGGKTYMNLLFEAIQPINLIDSQGHDPGLDDDHMVNLIDSQGYDPGLDDDHMVHSIHLLNGRLLQDAGPIQPEASPLPHAEKYVGQTSNYSTAALVEQAHPQPHNPIDYGVQVMARQDIQENSMIATTESFVNLNRSIEVQVPLEQTSSALVDLANNFFFDEDFLSSPGGDDIYRQLITYDYEPITVTDDCEPITVTDEWFEDALQEINLWTVG